MNRRPRLGVLVAAALVLGSWSGIAAAEPLERELGFDDVVRDVTIAEDGDGVRLNVLVDGDADGPPRIEQLVVHPADSAEVLDELAEARDVVAAERDHVVSVASDPLSVHQYAPARIRSDRLPSSLDGSGTVVAVVDTGVQGDHPDFRAGPFSPSRVLDGTTFLSGSPLDGQRGDVDPNGHGTHAAGIIAAERGNGIGIAGIAPGAQILPVRALDAAGNGTVGDVTKAVLYAHDQGAHVINLSLTGPTASSVLNTVIDHVTSDTSRGRPASVVVAASGNTGDTRTLWPAAHPRTIAVAATDQLDRTASFSTGGSHLNLAAPGVGIASTCVEQAPPYALFCTMSGTSMAAPHVAAVAALIASQHPTFTPDQVRHRLESTAQDIATLGRDTATGAGRLDAAAALGVSPVVVRALHQPTGSFSSVQVDGARITVRGTANDPEGVPKVRIESTVAGRRSVRVATPTGSSTGGTFAAAWNDVSGTHRICVSVIDVPTNAARSLGCRDAVVK